MRLILRFYLTLFPEFFYQYVTHSKVLLSVTELLNALDIDRKIREKIRFAVKGVPLPDLTVDIHNLKTKSGNNCIIINFFYFINYLLKYYFLNLLNQFIMLVSGFFFSRI